MSALLIERLELKDAVGRRLTCGARVVSTGYETPFTETRQGSVVDARSGPPVLAVRWDGDCTPFWHSVDINWRVYDVRLLPGPPTEETDKEEGK